MLLFSKLVWCLNFCFCLIIKVIHCVLTAIIITRLVYLLGGYHINKKWSTPHRNHPTFKTCDFVGGLKSGLLLYSCNCVSYNCIYVVVCITSHKTNNNSSPCLPTSSWKSVMISRSQMHLNKLRGFYIQQIQRPRNRSLGRSQFVAPLCCFFYL